MADQRDKIFGALFDNQKKEKKSQPDFWGNITVTEEFARELYNRARSGKNGEFRLNVSGWWKEPKDRNSKVDRFISMSVDFGQDKEGAGGRGRDDRGPPRRDDRGSDRRDDRGPPRRDDRDERGRQGRGEFSDEIPF